MFTQYMKMLHWGGVLTQYTGMEPDFPKHLSQAITGISFEDSFRFISIISQAAYGPDPTDPMDELFAADIYTVTAKYISSGMSLKKRLIFKYVKGF